jgi:hypothetical protein
MEFVTKKIDVSNYNLTTFDEEKTLDIKLIKLIFMVYDEDEIIIVLDTIEINDGFIVWIDDKSFIDQEIPAEFWNEVNEAEVSIREDFIEPREEAPGFGTMADFWKWKEG